jgi:hypothetical protein
MWLGLFTYMALNNETCSDIVPNGQFDKGINLLYNSLGLSKEILMRKLRPLKRLPRHLRPKVAASSPAADSDFCEVGIPYETLEFLAIDDEMRRGLTAMLSLKEPIQSLQRKYPDMAAELKRDAVTIGRWIDGRLKTCVRTIEEVQFSRLIADAKASSSLSVSAGLADRYSRQF